MIKLKVKLIKFTLCVFVYAIAFYLFLKSVDNYPVAKEDISQSFYIAVFVVKNVYILFGLGFLIQFIRNFKS